VNTAELYDPVTGAFSDTTGSMTTTRERHTATLLPNGKVLLAGGQNASVNPVNTAELFDPTTGLFTAIADTMASARTGHTATMLPDGRVLIGGGQSTNGAGSELNTAEIFDPSTNTFTTVTNTMVSARTFPQANLLPNGRVLIAGGLLDSAGGPLNTAERFTPVTETFTATAGTLTTTRVGHRTVLLPNGLVLVAGGRNASNVRLSSAELYDPAADNFSATGSMGTARVSPTITLLANGQVLVTGGLGPSGNLATAEVYTPALCVAAAIPSITGIAPPSAVVGTSVTITGTSFGATQGASTVTFNGVDAGVATSWSDMQIVINVPAGATTGNVVVTVGGTPSNGFAFTVLVPDFTLSASPPSRTIAQGQSTTYSVSLSPLNGFNSPVTLNVTSGLPANAGFNFSTNPVTPPGNTTLTVTTAFTTPVGTSPAIVIEGTGGAQTPHNTSVALTVTPNLAPTAVTQSQTTNEDTAKVLTLSGTDPESAALAFAITTPPTKGNVGVISAPTCAAGTCTVTVTYTPSPNANGLDDFQFTVNDGGLTSTPATVSLTITPVNDAPIFTVLTNQTLKVNDKPATPIGPQIVPIVVAPGPATATDESSQLITSVTANVISGGSLGTVPAGALPFANGVATLTFTPAANQSGTATIQVTATDNGSGTAPNVNTFSQDFTVTVTNASTGLTLDLRSLTPGTFDIVQGDAGSPVASGFTTELVERALPAGDYTVRTPAGNPAGQLVRVTVGAADCAVSLR
jgi:hypothetical protein